MPDPKGTLLLTMLEPLDKLLLFVMVTSPLPEGILLLLTLNPPPPLLLLIID